ncbi:MAG: hypothetical protein JWN99_1985, partial [Ilumatobacteraceae bacterium]|nr:hypothetical protein [Ilumatobacteraceae bacterium]
TATAATAAATSTAPDVAPIVQTVEAAPVDASPGRRGRWAALALAAIVIGAVIAFVVNRNGDTSPTTSPTTSASTPATDVSTTVARTTTTVATTVPSTEASVATTTSTPATSTPDTASTATDSSSPTSETTSPAQTAIPTPASVTSPSARVATGTLACEPAADGSYTPAGNCYVPLNKGNMVVYVDGSMNCADPPGTSMGKITTFAIGVDGDPLALFGDGKLVPKCGDLTYAKNILAGGAAKLDGLCGSSNTAIGDDSLRCFAQNAETGAMAALVAGPGSPASIVASCFTSAGTPTATPLTWTKSTVNATWRIVSLVYDPSAKQFTASATKNGVPTTATFACA